MRDEPAGKQQTIVLCGLASKVTVTEVCTVPRALFRNRSVYREHSFVTRDSKRGGLVCRPKQANFFFSGQPLGFRRFL